MLKGEKKIFRLMFSFFCKYYQTFKVVPETLTIPLQVERKNLGINARQNAGNEKYVNPLPIVDVTY